MKSYDAHLDRITDEYNTGCICYQSDDGREEYCKTCDTYCQNYVETLDIDDIAEQIGELSDALWVDDIGAKKSICHEEWSKKLDILAEELKNRMKGKSKTS